MKTRTSKFVLLAVAVFVTAGFSSAQVPTIFRIGEKLTYTVSFDKSTEAAFVETYVVSRGQLAKRDAVELRMRLKTDGVASTFFAPVDEQRTVFAAPDGTPLIVRRTQLTGPIPKETETNMLALSSGVFDLLTALYKARETGGNGSFQVIEETESSTVTFAASGTASVKTDAGDFDASISTVQSTYLENKGIKNLKIWFASDEFHIPVAFTFKTAKGEFRGRLAGISLGQPPVPTPTPTPAATPVPTPTVAPTPKPTPVEYVDNQPLLPELGFELGEQLDYRVTQGGRPVGTLSLSARERKRVGTQDSLFLTARVTGVEPGSRVFGPSDTIVATVNPDTLAPRAFDARLTNALAPFSQSVAIDQRTGVVSVGNDRIDGPIGVHSFLSLIYAMRSFNLKPSGDRSNPVNDTRVAVFWVDKVYIFSLRPGAVETLAIGEEKVPAQVITINTGNAQLDQLGIKVWLGNDETRRPVRFAVGGYQADLVNASIQLPK